MKRYIDAVLKQFSSCGRFLIMILSFVVYATICYSIMTSFDIYNNISEKILFETLIVIWLLSPLLLNRKNVFAVIWCAIAGVVTLVLMTCTICIAFIYKIDAPETCWEVLSTSSWAEIKEFLSDLPLTVNISALGGILVIVAIWLIQLFFVIRSKKGIEPLRLGFLPINVPFLLCFTPFTVILIVYLLSSEPHRILKKSMAFRYGYELVEFRMAQGRLSELNELPPLTRIQPLTGRHRIYWGSS